MSASELIGTRRASLRKSMIKFNMVITRDEAKKKFGVRSVGRFLYRRSNNTLKKRKNTAVPGTSGFLIGIRTHVRPVYSILLLTREASYRSRAKDTIGIFHYVSRV